MGGPLDRYAAARLSGYLFVIIIYFDYIELVNHKRLITESRDYIGRLLILVCLFWSYIKHTFIRYISVNICTQYD